MIKVRRINLRALAISVVVAIACAFVTTEGLYHGGIASLIGLSPIGIMLSDISDAEKYRKFMEDSPNAHSTYTDKVIEYAPPSGRGPIVILLSGVIGPKAYRRYSANVARLGYYVVLLHGHAVSLSRYGEDDLRKIIERAQHSPKALPGKVAVIGFSWGGGAAITHASRLSDLVSTVVVYYPVTMHIQDMSDFATRFQVPTLVLSGEQDTYLHCCLIESMRAMEAAALEVGAPFELVAYPNVTHSFNLKTHRDSVYKAETADAWQRTTKMLKKYHPLFKEDEADK